MSKRSDEALIALRQIQRRTELASKRLAQTAQLTPSQLQVLQILDEKGETPAGELSELTQLKQATITSLLDKLERRGLVNRRRCQLDRRRVWIKIQRDGIAALEAAPDLLQDTFSNRFAKLADWEQSMLVAALERVSSLMNA
ncbi:MAG: MarR family winged helix-turn-helix transcriptional regulator, partial [Henriciella sp.]